MIFYFSGTGNSLWAAENISISQKERLFSIADEAKNNNYEFTLNDGELIGFVFPIYAWDAPKFVINFIKKLKLNNYNANYTFAIGTCEANVGLTMKNLRTTLNAKNIELSSAFSLTMPSNYSILYPVQSKASVDSILDMAEKKLKEINESIEKKEKKSEIILGSLPFFKTKIINPLFMKYAINTKKFSVSDSCISCGLCEKVCPVSNIKLSPKPTWGNNCTQCLACISRCPKKAIEYGKHSKDRERYYNPRCKNA